MLLEQLSKKKANGEVVKIDGSSLFNMLDLLLKHGLLTPEIAKLTDKLLAKINKKKK